MKLESLDTSLTTNVTAQYRRKWVESAFAWFIKFKVRHQPAKANAALSGINSHLLRDIGVERHELEEIGTCIQRESDRWLSVSIGARRPY